MPVWTAAGLFLWLLALLLPCLPGRVVFLIWGNRRRILLTEKGEKIVDRTAASKQLKIVGAMLFLKTLCDFLIWTFFH